MKKLVQGFRIVPMIVVMGTIFFLSHQPATELKLPFFPGFDKFAHAIAYACFAAASIFAVPKQCRTSNPQQTAVLVVVICLLYGISDEYHQSFIPGRNSSVGDLLADAVGAALLTGAWLHYNKTSSSKASSSREKSSQLTR